MKAVRSVGASRRSSQCDQIYSIGLVSLKYISKKPFFLKKCPKKKYKQKKMNFTLYKIVPVFNLLVCLIFYFCIFFFGRTLRIDQIWI